MSLCLYANTVFATFCGSYLELRKLNFDHQVYANSIIQKEKEIT